MNQPTLGVCYYPEHWDEEQWAPDAAAMVQHGISIVRIGEFAWSRIEPSPEHYQWEWLDTAIDVLAAAGLNIILGTPTACPPHWLIKAHPDILPIGVDGRPRQFGSRRHYSFSSEVYAEHSRRITKRLAERYGHHPALVGWQLDNEYGCHDTTVCYSDQALNAFHLWLQRRYGTIGALNDAWGNVFWSQEYSHFRDVGFPIAVTETNPSHRLAFQRFSSDQVRVFSDQQAEILRHNSKPDAWLTHNFMGNFIDFDHYAVMASLDIASWDSYPLGFLDQGWFDEDTKRRFRRTGHPDWAAFHHDLYRGVGDGRFAVMEQQPGSVNWASNNAQPIDGMVRLWSHEAIAHGAEFVSWFRWRQAPFAQEQMHAGLMRSDGQPAQASAEVKRLNDELGLLGNDTVSRAPVALLFDYEACWLTDIQPHSDGYNALQIAFEYYSAARALGLDIDILPPTAALNDYQIILMPCLPFVSEDLADRLEKTNAAIVIGPRAGSKTSDCSIPDNMAPGPLQRLINLKVTSVDGVRAGIHFPLRHEPTQYAFRWIEQVETSLQAQWGLADGRGILFQEGRVCYLAANVDHSATVEVIAAQCVLIGLETLPLPDNIRLRNLGRLRYVFNYSDEPQASPVSGQLLVGEEPLSPAGVNVYRIPE